MRGSEAIMILLDLILIIITAASVVSSIILNRRMLVIQQHRVEMLKMLRDFDSAVARSESAIGTIQKLFNETSHYITNTQNNINKKSEDLHFLFNTADKLSDELEIIIASGNRVCGKLVDTLSEVKKWGSKDIDADSTKEDIVGTIDLEQANKTIDILQDSYAQMQIHKKRVG